MPNTHVVVIHKTGNIVLAGKMNADPAIQRVVAQHGDDADTLILRFWPANFRVGGILARGNTAVVPQSDADPHNVVEQRRNQVEAWARKNLLDPRFTAFRSASLSRPANATFGGHGKAALRADLYERVVHMTYAAALDDSNVTYHWGVLLQNIQQSWQSAVKNLVLGPRWEDSFDSGVVTQYSHAGPISFTDAPATLIDTSERIDEAISRLYRI